MRRSAIGAFLALALVCVTVPSALAAAGAVTLSASASTIDVGESVRLSGEISPPAGGQAIDIVDVTGYPTGTVYPALRRLERDGYVRSRWEDDRSARRDGRPARRYYELTASGVKALEAAVDTLNQLNAVRLRVTHAR